VHGLPTDTLSVSWSGALPAVPSTMQASPASGSCGGAVGRAVPMRRPSGTARPHTACSSGFLEGPPHRGLCKGVIARCGTGSAFTKGYYINGDPRYRPRVRATYGENLSRLVHLKTSTIRPTSSVSNANIRPARLTLEMKKALVHSGFPRSRGRLLVI